MDGFDLTKLCIQFDFGCSNATAKSVLVALASHYNEDNGKVWPSAEVLCREASCHRNSLFNAIKWLRDNGIVETKRTWGGNVYKFNIELIRRGCLAESTKPNTYQSIEFNTSVSTKDSTYARTESSTNESTGFSTNVSTKNDTLLSTENDTYQSTNIRTQTNKEQIKEQIINQEDLIKSCFSSFGSNPVSRPTQWEMDSDNCYDLPLSQQIAMCRKVEVDINDDNHVLTASEIVVLASQLGYRITHNALIDEVAQRKTVTVKIVKEACRRTRENATTNPIGYLVNSMQNASKDPDAFLGIRKVPEITAETLTDGQAYNFAKKLANYHPWASHNAKYMETTEQMISRVTDSIKNPVFFNNCRWALEKLGLVKEAQHV